MLRSCVNGAMWLNFSARPVSGLTMYYYAAIERFDHGNGERWVGFTRWLGRTDLQRIVTLDSALCPPVVHPQSANDWQFVAQEEFMLDFFTDLNFVRQRTAGHRPSEVIAVARDPSAETVAGFPHPDFELAGFDILDAQLTGSVIFNPNRFPGAINVSKLSAESGLIRSRDWAFKVRDTLCRRHPAREDARFYVWAIWRYIGVAGDSA